MRVGPFHSFHIQKLIAHLNELKISHELVQDPNVHQEMKNADLERSLGFAEIYERGVYQSRGDFLYIEMDEKDVQKILPELEKYGFVPTTVNGSKVLPESSGTVVSYPPIANWKKPTLLWSLIMVPLALFILLLRMGYL